MQKMKPEMQDIMINIKLMKILRDINLIKKEFNFFDTKKIQQNKIHKNKKYNNLLKLIRNHFLHYSHYSEKLTINTLRNINIKFYENICNFNNIIVVDQPVFQTGEFTNGVFNIRNNSIDDYVVNTKLDANTFIKNNHTKLIYLYLITDNRIRCKYVYDKNYLSENRKEKLKLIKEKEYI